MKAIWSAIVLLLGMFLYASSVFAIEVTISSPLDGESVGQRHDIIGQVSDPNANVIVVIRPGSVSEFWTQPPVTVRNNGQWRVKSYFGRRGMDHGEEYEVRAFANPQSQTREGKYSTWPSAEARSNVVAVTRR
jgi:hypothetical protein